VTSYHGFVHASHPVWLVQDAYTGDQCALQTRELLGWQCHWKMPEKTPFACLLSSLALLLTADFIVQAKQASCQCNAMDEICFACAMKSAVSSKARELSRHAKGVVSGIFQ